MKKIIEAHEMSVIQETDGTISGHRSEEMAMSKLLGISFAGKFLKELAKCKESVTIISPYVTKGAVLSLLDALPPKLKCKLITVPPGREYLFGSVEVEALIVMHKKKFEISVLPDLHAKLYVLDQSHVFMGSANFTLNGWSENGNVEEMIKIPLSQKDLDHIAARYIIPSSLLDLNGEWVKKLEDQRKIAEEYRVLQEKLAGWEKELANGAPEVKEYYSKSLLPPKGYAHHFKFPIAESSGNLANKNKSDFLFRLGDDGGKIFVNFAVVEKMLIKENLSESKVWGLHINFDEKGTPYLICPKANKGGKVKLDKKQFTGKLETVALHKYKKR